MAPIRRYLRISQYSVLEVRVYLDDPAVTQSWFLNPRDPVLPRVIQAIRPLVLPKLREERERSKGKSKKQKSVKDVVSGDDFEASIFLSNSSSRHSLLTKQKTLNPKSERIQSNSSKLTEWLVGSKDKPVNVENEDPIILREESDDERTSLEDIPEADPDQSSSRRTSQTLGKRSRQTRDETQELYGPEFSENEPEVQDLASEKRTAEGNEDAEQVDDKKKFAMNTAYEGFSIYGKMLCLVVKQKGDKGKIPGSVINDAGEQLLENWVSTQAAQEPILDDG